MSTKKKAAQKKKVAKATKSAKKEDAKLFAPQIVTMLKAGKTAKEIATALKCRRGYVYIVRKNEGIAKPAKEVKAKKAPVAKKKVAAKAPAKKAVAKKPAAKVAKVETKKAETKPVATGAVAQAKADAKIKLPVEKAKLETMRKQYADEQKGAALTTQQLTAIGAQERKVKNIETLANG